MTKRFFLLLVIAGSLLTALAQNIPGSWRVLPTRGAAITDVTETAKFVYYLCGTSTFSGKYMFCYDKENQETRFMTPSQVLSDIPIDALYPNPAGGYTLATYTNGNIDLIYDDGRIVNLPEIKNSSITISKRINEAKFADGRIYLATDFGIVIYDDQNYVVIESGIYNKPIKHILPLGDRLLIQNPENGFLAVSPLSERHNSLDKFTQLQPVSIDDWMPFDDTNYLVFSGGKLVKVTVPLSGGMQFATVGTVDGAKKFLPASSGYHVIGSASIAYITPDGKIGETVALPAQFQGQPVASYAGAKRLWHGNYKGLAAFDISTSPVTVLSDYALPEGVMQQLTHYAVHSADGSKVYFACPSESESLEITPKLSSYQGNTLVESYEWATGKVTPIGPIDLEYDQQETAESKKWAKYFDFHFGATSGQGLIADPVDPDLVYRPSQWEGVFVYKNDKIVDRWDGNKGPYILGNWQMRPMSIQFDNNGNLWLSVYNGIKAGDAAYNPAVGRVPGILRVLPREAVDRFRAGGQIKATDWIFTSAFPESFVGKMDMNFLFSSKSNKMLLVTGWDSGIVYGYDTKGTTDTSDDSYAAYTKFIDQDGNMTMPIFKMCITEDHDGDLWIGTVNGIFVVKDLQQIADGSGDPYLRTVRPKVSRNDGTNYADYLLASDRVYAIAVDVNNNKWIGTKNSGLYQVSPDGTEILNHFTAANSPLPSDCVTMLACNPAGNDVLIGTNAGVCVYSSDSAPAADDLSDVYAFPNPVRPDYEGWITITGLMDGTLVKITDAQGALVHQGRSEGGMLLWDGCDAGGNHVHSGVYMVFASAQNGSQSNNAVTKIVVIK